MVVGMEPEEGFGVVAEAPPRPFFSVEHLVLVGWSHPSMVLLNTRSEGQVKVWATMPRPEAPESRHQ